MLYDGDCALCTGTVQFVLDHEKDAALHFAPLQSDVGRSYLKELGLAVDDFDSYRIRWFGRPTSCRRPDPAAAHRFLGEGQTISWTAVAS